MDLNALALFALTEFLLSLTPGPAVLLVAGLSLRSGMAPGLAAAAGILTVNTFYFVLSAIGVGALILASATVFTVLKIAGALYLAYLGLQLLRPLLDYYRSNADPAIGAVIGSTRPDAAPRGQPLGSSFRSGVMLQASNPKTIAFFVAILPQFVSPAGHLGLQLTVLGIVSVAIELPVLILYSSLFARLSRRLTRVVVIWIEGCAGALLIMLGSLLALYQRSD